MQHQLCIRGHVTGNSLYISLQPYHHIHRRQWGRFRGQMQGGTSCFVYFRNNMEIKVTSLWTKIRSSIPTWSRFFSMGPRLEDLQGRSSPTSRPSLIANSGTPIGCGGQGRSRMRISGSVPRRRRFKLPYGDGNEDGSATLWGILPPTSPACLLSRTLKGLRGLERELSSKNIRTWGCYGIKWKGLHKTGPLESCSGGPVLRLERRGWSQSMSHPY